jgi:hypothetical protein
VATQGRVVCSDFLDLYLLEGRAAHPIRRVETMISQESEKRVPMRVPRLFRDQHAFGALGSCVPKAGSGGLV